jgi:hypothetical protein
MATYVPGAPSYMPNWKPFTPDYKFLSDVLDVKTNKYNTNYKTINDLYSKVVYADLQRKDTQELRDQYANGLGKQLQKISGMDLSVMQNADAAKGLFRPFYEEDIIVQDMVHTSNIRKQMQYADDLKNSLDPEQHAMYWGDGVEYLNWKNEDFKNASEERALKMPLPKYIPDADLYNRAMTYLEGKGYDVTAPSESSDGKWIIHDTNGGLISKQALADVTLALGNDSRVRDAYYANAYVQSRRFADEAMKDGKAATVNDGITLWSQDKLQTATKEMGVKVNTINRMLEGMDIKKTQWEKLEKKINIVPGSREDMAKRQFESEHEAFKESAKNYEKSIKDAQDLLTSDNYEDMHNKAYNVLMANNITSDLTNAAFLYSERTKKQTKEPNIYKVNEIKYNQSRALKRLESRLNREEIILEDQLKNAGKNSLLNILDLGGAAKPPNAIPSGAPMTNAEEQLAKGEEAQMFAEAEVLSKIYINSATIENTNSVKIPGKWKGTGVVHDENGYSIINNNNLKGVLADPKNHHLLLKAGTEVYDKMNTEEPLTNFPYAGGKGDFNIDKAALAEVLVRRKALDRADKQFHKVMYDGNEMIKLENAASLQKLSTQKKWEDLTEKEKGFWKGENTGWPLGEEAGKAAYEREEKRKRNWGGSEEGVVMSKVQGFDPLDYLFENVDADPTKRTKEEFLNVFKERPDLMNKVREQITSSKWFGNDEWTWFTDKPTPVRSTDNAEVLEALSEIYDERNTLINRGMTGEFNIPYDDQAELEPGQKIPNRYPQFNLTESLWGVSPTEQQSGDLAVFPIYEDVISSYNPQLEATKLLENFINQVKGDPNVIMNLGDLSGKIPIENSADALNIWEQYRIALHTDISTGTKTPKSIAIINYTPNLGDGKAGYTLTFKGDWWSGMQGGGAPNSIKKLLTNTDKDPSISIVFPQQGDVSERSVESQRFSTIKSLANADNGYNHINEIYNGGSIQISQKNGGYYLQVIMQQYGINPLNGKRGYYNIPGIKEIPLGNSPGTVADIEYKKLVTSLLNNADANEAAKNEYNTYNK